MGYYACGSGDATLKEGVNEEELTLKLEEIIKEGNLEIEFDFFKNKDGSSWIDFNESDDHWHEEDTDEFLNALIPYITEGSAAYNGDENCHWRYRFVPEEGKWTTDDGIVAYGPDYQELSDENLVAALEKRGYKVKKAA